MKNSLWKVHLRHKTPIRSHQRSGQREHHDERRMNVSTQRRRRSNPSQKIASLAEDGRKEKKKREQNSGMLTHENDNSDVQIIEDAHTDAIPLTYKINSFVEQDSTMLKHLTWGAIDAKGRLLIRAGGLKQLLDSICNAAKEKRSNTVSIDCEDTPGLSLVSFISSEDKGAMARKLAAIYAFMNGLPNTARIKVLDLHIIDIITMHMQKAERGIIYRDPRRNKFRTYIKHYEKSKLKYIDAKGPEIYDRTLKVWRCIFCCTHQIIGSYHKFTTHMLDFHKREIILVHAICKYGITIYRTLIDDNVFAHMSELQAFFHGFQNIIIDFSREKFILDVLL